MCWRQHPHARMEAFGRRSFDIDWGRFGTLIYNGATRKLYAYCLVDCHSRKTYLEFTHSESFETFIRCHIHAFEDLGGCAREYGFVPRACHVAAAWEKERSSALSVMCVRTSGRCGLSPTSPT